MVAARAGRGWRRRWPPPRGAGAEGHGCGGVSGEGDGPRQPVRVCRLIVYVVAPTRAPRTSVGVCQLSCARLEQEWLPTTPSTSIRHSLSTGGSRLSARGNAGAVQGARSGWCLRRSALGRGCRIDEDERRRPAVPHRCDHHGRRGSRKGDSWPTTRRRPAPSGASRSIGRSCIASRSICWSTSARNQDRYCSPVLEEGRCFEELSCATCRGRRCGELVWRESPSTGCAFVAILVAAGCNVREISEWAGHNSVAFP